MAADMVVYDDTNIFAKILRGEMPSVRVYEDENAIALMDVMPQAQGHVLVIPRQASRNLLDADVRVLENLIKIVQKIAQAAKTALHADGVTVMQFNEAAGGQSVYHLHFHIIPRFEGIALNPHHSTMADPDLLEQIAQKIRAAL